MYRYIQQIAANQIGVDRWGRSFLSGLLVALAVATLAMFIAIPVWNEVRDARSSTANHSPSPPPFSSEGSIPVGTDAEVASSSAVGI